MLRQTPQKARLVLYFFDAELEPITKNQNVRFTN